MVEPEIADEQGHTSNQDPFHKAAEKEPTL